VNVLLLGGGVFLGPHLIDALLARGHAVTAFTRGRREVPGGALVARVTGDRDGGLDAVPRDGWDAVVDTSGYVPRIVSAAAQRFASAGRYAFVSTISVYDDRLPEAREDSPVQALSDGVDPATETVDGATYGPLKAACEAVVRDAFEERALVVRPGLIVGPLDPSDRFTYWPERAARGGAILAPGPPERYVQFIDVRDLAALIVRALEHGRAGTVNATGPPHATTMGDVVGASRASAATQSEVVWVDDAFLEREGVEPWTGLPLWIPASLGLEGFSNANVERALSWGMTLRPLAQTTADTLAWVRTLPGQRERKAGISPEREAELVTAWRAAT
jgi:nucleoside-diphosphate-sugar epimerase